MKIVQLFFPVYRKEKACGTAVGGEGRSLAIAFDPIHTGGSKIALPSLIDIAGSEGEKGSAC